MASEHGLSIRQSCEALGISRTAYYYKPDRSREEVIIAALLSVAEKYPKYGFKKLFIKLRQAGHGWNHKCIHRIYCMLKLNLRRKGKKRLPTRNPQALCVPEQINQTWSADFMSDALMCGRKFRTFNVVDDFNREALAIEIDFSLPAQRVIRVLDNIALIRGYPMKIRLDNGPEFISLALAEWAEHHEVILEFIEPGKPTQNSFIERFNRTYREEVLDFYLFKNIKEVNEITKNWIQEYNEERPHESLENMSPTQYKLVKNKQENSSYLWH